MPFDFKNIKDTFEIASYTLKNASIYSHELLNKNWTLSLELIKRKIYQRKFLLLLSVYIFIIYKIQIKIKLYYYTYYRYETVNHKIQTYIH